MDNHDIILVDPEDTEIGTGEKLDVHRRGILHRAFSVLVFNSEGKLLLQRRATAKYHSGGLWTNTCCSHPMPGENTLEAAHRRLKEEMGFDCPLQYSHHFIYRAELDQGLIEHELDHIFIGKYDGIVIPDRNEVSDYRFESLHHLQEEVQQSPEMFTPWFIIILKNIAEISPC